MARYGTWRPLANNWASQPKMKKFDLVILHTMVGSLAGTDGMFRADGYGGVESHFGLGSDGTLYQWQDTAYQAEANGAANSRAISVETADIGPGFAKWNTNDGNAVPAWTDAQLDALVNLVVWACRTHDIPCAMVADSKPGRRGIAYHRLGVPGYAVAGGELWSSARGKACPGNRRIAQVPLIVLRAAKILAGATPVVAKPADTGFPTLKVGDSGDLLARLQSWLTRKYSYAKIDLGPRVYGPQTTAVIKEFQARMKITGADADGTVIGPRTWAALVQEGFK